MKVFLKWLFGKEFYRAIEKIRLQEREYAKKEYCRKNMVNLNAISSLLVKNELLYEKNTDLEEKLKKANEEIEELKIYRLQYLEMLQRTVK